jgi:Flp pilus assembly protein TadB
VFAISEQFEQYFNKVFPDLKEELKIAQMDGNLTVFMTKCLILGLILSASCSLAVFFITLSFGMPLLTIPIYFLLVIAFFYLGTKIPKINQQRIRKEIESNIFTLGGMLLTLLESGDSIISALEGVADSKAKGGKYFGQVASEIYLGKNLDQSIEDAIRYTPSESFRRIFEPIKISIRTGADIKQPLVAALKELSHERIVEIEQYEKKLSPFSMLYMIFGTILPAMGIVGFVLIMSVMGIKVEFFPFLFILILLVVVVQIVFIEIVRSMRPLVRL